MSSDSNIPASRSALTGGAALVVWGDVKSADIDEAALNDWWTNEHLPERISLPGFLRARRYFAREESSKSTRYLTLYETATLATLTSPEYMEKLNDPTPGTKQHIPTLASMNRAACKVVHSEVRPDLKGSWTISGTSLAMIEFRVSSEESLREQAPTITSTFSDRWKNDKTFMSYTLLQEDVDATAPGSSSQSYLNVNLKTSTSDKGCRCLLLLEFSNPAQLPFNDLHDTLDRIRQDIKSLSMEIERDSIRMYHFLAGLSR